MGTDVISSLAGTLDAELEKARETLRSVDDDIKKVFGKDASELQIFGRNRRGPPGGSGEQKEDFYNKDHFQFQSRVRRRDDYNDPEEPMEKRRRGDMAGGGWGGGGGGPLRFGSRQSFEGNDEFMQVGRRLASRIVTSGREKSREEVLEEQRKDRPGRERNRRMFGALLGTLQRFKQDETKLKDKEDKRAQIEAKLDEQAKKEREVVRSKKQELIKERKIKLTEIKRIEVKRTRIQELEQWEEKTKYLTNFIRTEAKPHIFYLPKVMNPITDCRLEQSKQYVTEMISHKRKIVLEDLEDYEERSKRYWESRVAGRATRKIDPMDADFADELEEIMKNEDVDVQLEETDDLNEEQTSKELESNGTGREEMNEDQGNSHSDDRMEEEAEVTEETTIEVNVEEEKDDEVTTTNEAEEPSQDQDEDDPDGEPDQDE